MAKNSPVQFSDGRIYTTHTGSLPRPQKLKQLYIDRSRGQKVDPGELMSESRAALRWVVPKQIETGIDVVNDGEQQRDQFFRYIQRRLSGFGGSWNRNVFADLIDFPEFKIMEERIIGKEVVSHNEGLPKAIDEVRYTDDSAIKHECAEFRSALDEVRGKFTASFMTAPSPGLVARGMKNEHYDNEENYLKALGEAFRVEYEAIVDSGFILQIDAPDLALERHVTYQDRPLDEFLSFVERVVSTINQALRNIPREKVRMHVCWGNYEGPHSRDVELVQVLPLIRKAKVGAFVLPFANGRHAHEYRCFEAFPLDDDQVLVAGVIDSLTNFIEHPEAVADRIERISAVVGDPRRVIAGTDCGFETSTGRRRVADDIVWAKLRSLTAGARIASERLF
jgi:5-methyltetrahydropteroyltriglutamate--homocysteine methyltransferase